MSITIILTMLSIVILVVFSILINRISNSVENISIEDSNIISSKKSKIINMVIKANIIFILFYFVYLGFPVATLNLLEGKDIPLYWYLLGLLVLSFNLIWSTKMFKFSETQKNVLVFSNRFQDYTMLSDAVIAMLIALIIAGIVGALSLGITIFILPSITDDPYLLAAFIVLALIALLTHLILISENKRPLSHFTIFLYFSSLLFAVSLAPTKDNERFIFYMYTILSALVWIFLNMEETEVEYNKDELTDYGFMWIDDDVIYTNYSEISLKRLSSLVGNDAIFGFIFGGFFPIFLFVTISLATTPNVLENYSIEETTIFLIRIVIFIASIILYERLFNSLNLLNLKSLNINVTNSLINAIKDEKLQEVIIKFDYDLNLGDELEATLLANLDSWIRFLLDDVKYSREKNEFTLTLNKEVLEYWMKEVEYFSNKLPNLNIDTLAEKVDFSKTQAFFLLSVFSKILRDE